VRWESPVGPIKLGFLPYRSRIQENEHGLQLYTVGGQNDELAKKNQPGRGYRLSLMLLGAVGVSGGHHQRPAFGI